MSTKKFFRVPSEQSKVKATIVSKYFWSWAKVIIPSAKTHGGKISYIDLFAGPGRYYDGAKSTPLLVLETAIKDDDIREMLVSIFNDKDEDASQSLEKAIGQVKGIDTLRYKPNVYNYEIDENMARVFEDMRLIPTLFFIDPWGYKGLSVSLIWSVLKDWGCDCIFFFNYNRISIGLKNPKVEQHMNALFGEERADKLREMIKGLNPLEKERRIIKALSAALKEKGGGYVVWFRFKNHRIYHLFFVSKNFRGYHIMKEIMAAESTSDEQGVPSFEYNPNDLRYLFLFDTSSPLDDLEEMLLQDFAQRELTMEQIYQDHSVGKRFIKKNYKDVLERLEQKGKIITNPPADKRREGTFGDAVIVSFPSKDL